MADTPETPPEQAAWIRSEAARLMGAGQSRADRSRAGKARQAGMTKRQRSELARRAARARWDRVKSTEPS